MLENPAKLGQRHRLAFLFKDSIIYGGATAISRAFALITFPLLTRYFSIEDYGLVDLFTVFVSFMSIVIIFGQDSSVARYFYEYTDNKSRKELISQSLIFQIALMVLVLPVLWLSSFRLAPLISSSVRAEELLRINILQIPALVFINFSVNLLKWTFSRSKFLIVSLGSVVTNVIFIVIGITFIKMDLTGTFICALSSQLIFALLSLYFVRSWLVFPSEWKFIRELLVYAAPYGVICCLSAFVPTMERSLVNSFLGGRELGLYAAGAKVAMLMGIVVQAFQTAWGPFSLSIHKEEDAINTYNWALKGFVVLVCLMVLSLTSFAESLLSILASERYTGASVVVFPLTMGLAAQAIGWITTIGIGISKKSYLNLINYSIFVLVTGVSIYFLAKPYGLVGIASGVMIGHIANALVSTYLAQRAYPMNWSFSSLFVPILLTISLGVFIVREPIQAGLFVHYFSRFWALVTFLIVVYLLMLNKEEKIKIRILICSYCGKLK